MLARTFRLRKRDIARLYKKGKTLRENGLLVRYLPNNAKNSRFAVIIPKATVAKSVDRSRLKRKTHVFLFNLKKELIINYDIAITFKKIIEESEIEGILKKVFSGIGAIK